MSQGAVKAGGAETQVAVSLRPLSSTGIAGAGVEAGMATTEIAAARATMIVLTAIVLTSVLLPRGFVWTRSVRIVSYCC